MSTPVPTPLPIAAVERDTGLSKDTLRIWERRYGFPNPVRDALGDRAYPPDQVERLRLVKRLLDAGHRPGKLMALSLEELHKLGQEPVVGAAGQEDLGAFLALLQDHDVAALRRLLHQSLLELGLEPFVTQRIAPLNQAIGEAWLRGEIGISQEHVYTEALQLVLRQAIGSIPEPPGQVPCVLLATFPQEGHGLGLLMAEALLSLHGCRCVSLGVKVPIDSILEAAAQTRADIVGLSFSGSFPAGQALTGLRDLRQQLPEQVWLWAGGSSLALQRRLPDGVRSVNDIALVPALVQAWRDATASRAT